MKRNVSKLIAAILSVVMAVTVIPIPASAEETSLGVNYEEIPDAVSNPDCGFYRTCRQDAKPTDNTSKKPKAKLIHFRIGIGCFSHNYLKYTDQAPEDYVENGWTDLTEDFLTSLDGTMDYIRQNHGTVIVRFAYDNFDGVENMEPSMEGIQAHISQLQGFFEKNADVISAVESGFLGPWGEQHTSVLVDRDHRAENIPILVDALLDVVPEPITVSVRRPLYYCYAVGIQLKDLESYRAEKGSPYYRLGVFNDGYLGSESDRGTYSYRDIETGWLDYQGSHTLFGGEVASNYSTDGTVYNSFAYASEEMFKTHTAYLNLEWNTSVLNEWRNTPYSGDDEVYQGFTGFDYIQNHLGYRFVLRDSRLTNRTLMAKVENVGAANVIKPKNMSINLVDTDGNATEVPMDIDVRDWESRTINKISMDLPENIVSGNYTAYLKIADNNNTQIQFANDNTFNEYGNCLGSFVLEEYACDHKEEVINAVYASCSQEGYTGDIHCSVCDAFLEYGTVIPKKEHTPVVKNAVYASCSNNGYTGDIYCSVCDEFLERGVTILKKDHTLSDWASDGIGHHYQTCEICDEITAVSACADNNSDNACDTCGYVMSVPVLFDKKSSLNSGYKYLIVSGDTAMNQQLKGTSVSLSSDSGAYALTSPISDDLIWTNKSSKLYCEIDGVKYYLTADYDGTLSLTTNSANASTWISTSNRLSVKVYPTSGSFKWLKSKNYYLYQSDNHFKLTTSRKTLSFYRMQEN